MYLRFCALMSYVLMLARDRPPLAATYGKLEDVTPVPHLGKRRCAYGVEGKLLIGRDQSRER